MLKKKIKRGISIITFAFFLSTSISFSFIDTAAAAPPPPKQGQIKPPLPRRAVIRPAARQARPNIKPAPRPRVSRPASRPNRTVKPMPRPARPNIKPRPAARPGSAVKPIPRPRPGSIKPPRRYFFFKHINSGFFEFAYRIIGRAGIKHCDSIRLAHTFSPFTGIFFLVFTYCVNTYFIFIQIDHLFLQKRGISRKKYPTLSVIAYSVYRYCSITVENRSSAVRNRNCCRNRCHIDRLSESKIDCVRRRSEIVSCTTSGYRASVKLQGKQG